MPNTQCKVRKVLHKLWTDDRDGRDGFYTLSSSQFFFFLASLRFVSSFISVPKLVFLVGCSPFLKLFPCSFSSVTTYPSVPHATWPIDSASCSRSAFLPAWWKIWSQCLYFPKQGKEEAVSGLRSCFWGWKGTEWPCHPLPSPHLIFLRGRSSPRAWWANPFCLNQEGTVGGDILQIKEIIRGSFACTIDFGSRTC